MTNKPRIIDPNSPEFMMDAVDKRRAILENTGGWYSVTRKNNPIHYFVKGNEKSDMAISLCATVIVTVDKLHPVVGGQKCFACDLMVQAGKVGDFKRNIAIRRERAIRAQEIAEKHKAALAAKSKSNNHEE